MRIWGCRFRVLVLRACQGWRHCTTMIAPDAAIVILLFRTVNAGIQEVSWGCCRRTGGCLFPFAALQAWCPGETIDSYESRRGCFAALNGTYGSRQWVVIADVILMSQCFVDLFLDLSSRGWKKRKKGWLEAAEAYGAKNREERPLEPNAEERKRAYANNVNPWSRSSAADAAVEAVGVVDAVNSHNLHHRWRHAEFH